jgi:tRNA threonylcarbamoyladenosine biosynthesis protein TsaB
VLSDERVLAIDTSTEQAGVAVVSGDRSVELRWTSGREQTTSVLDQIDRCLALAGVRVDQLTGVAVAIGPGMFNGLRVGISLAKGFSLAQGVPIVGVSTLEITAHPWLGLGSDVLPVVAAGRGRIVWSRYAGRALVEAPQNMTIDEFIAAIRGMNIAPIVAGEFPEARVAELRSGGAITRVEAGAARSPLVLATLGIARLESGNQDDLVALEPVYVHGRSTVTPR